MPFQCIFQSKKMWIAILFTGRVSYSYFFSWLREFFHVKSFQFFHLKANDLCLWNLMLNLHRKASPFVYFYNFLLLYTIYLRENSSLLKSALWTISFHVLCGKKFMMSEGNWVSQSPLTILTASFKIFEIFTSAGFLLSIDVHLVMMLSIKTIFFRIKFTENRNVLRTSEEEERREIILKLTSTR